MWGDQLGGDFRSPGETWWGLGKGRGAGEEENHLKKCLLRKQDR